jgi:hypothetical protein
VNPITHGLFGWVLGNAPRETSRRERVLVTLGGVIPDVDGVGAVPDTVTRWLGWAQPTRFFFEYHHLLHTALFAAITTAGAAALAPKGVRARTAALFCAAFHLHLLCDVAGSRGPDGSQWPIPYWFPFAHADPHVAGWTWAHQWRLDGWQNVAITVALLVVTAALALRRGRSVVEVVSTRADGAVVEVLRRRFGRAAAGAAE